MSQRLRKGEQGGGLKELGGKPSDTLTTGHTLWQGSQTQAEDMNMQVTLAHTGRGVSLPQPGPFLTQTREDLGVGEGYMEAER